MDVKNTLIIGTIGLFLSTSVLASVPVKSAEKQRLIEELTGVKSKNVKSTAQNLKVATKEPLSRRHLNAGFQAFVKKDYIQALKHYNTILAKHPKSKEVKSAYLAKAKLYQEMGLMEQAKLNIRLSQQFENKNMTK